MDRRTFLGFTMPSNITMVLLMVVPLMMAVYLGLHFITYRNINEPQFIGLQNYIDVLTDPQFWMAFRWTILFIIIVVPSQIVIGFAVSMLLDQVSTSVRGFYLSVFLLPFIVVPVVGTLMFKQLFDPSGLGAWFFREVLESRFIFSEQSVKTLIIMHSIWATTPYALVTFFAGLQTLPGDLVEAASIDGANWVQKIRYVVIPHLSSLILLVSLISIMDMYRIFDSVLVLTEQNPIYKADTLMTYTFNVAMTVQRLGKANAMSVLTVIGVMVVLIPFLIQSYREQVEER